MMSKTGIVSKIRILKLSNNPLVRFTMNNDTNCLIANHSLNFLADVAESMRISAIGSYNQRGQFVVRQYNVLGTTKVMYEIDTSSYPHKRLHL